MNIEGSYEHEIDELSCGWLGKDYLLGKRFMTDFDDLGLFSDNQDTEEEDSGKILQEEEITEEIDLKFVELYDKIDSMFGLFGSFKSKNKAQKKAKRSKHEFDILDFKQEGS